MKERQLVMRRINFRTPFPKNTSGGLILKGKILLVFSGKGMFLYEKVKDFKVSTQCPEMENFSQDEFFSLLRQENIT